MLTIRAMTGGAGYDQRHLEHSDYYDEHRRVQGEWKGHGEELPCLESGPRDLGILQIEVIRRLSINLFLGQLKRVMPIASWQNRRSGKQCGGMNHELYVLMIGVLGDYFSSLNNDVQSFAPLKRTFFFASPWTAPGRLQRSGAVKGERSEFISTLDGEHR